ncbi:DUF3793 family protein [Fenollaria sporofastidiosus]|uniref:DUF3793 family protein n=1 Tax=Fenollaria sporofastidiosus TaxID=2811778 RepID=UPI001C003746|nr:DUF3793 family protein [Fenollaria sporofastidiosus]
MCEVKFESILANHCSPVLMGTKLSNLISVSKQDAGHGDELLKKYKSAFKTYGIAIEMLCECDERMQLFVYNEERLRRHLHKESIASFLMDYGYSSSDLSSCLAVLKAKLRHFEFPHEIGIFLGFPLDDVRSFIENQGQNYIYCSYWKVYHNPDLARRTFDLYDRLRAFVKSRLDEGDSIEVVMRDVYKSSKGLHDLLNAY